MTITPLSEITGTEADHTVTLAQIGRMTLMSCGARNIVYSDEAGMVMFRVGPGGKTVRKVIVKLLPSDTYAVEYGRMTMDPKSPKFAEWQVVEQETDVFAEELAATVRRLGDREQY